MATVTGWNMSQYRDDLNPMEPDPINRVLAEERASRHVMAAAEAEATRILENARQRAARILRHADTRITLVHQRCSQGTARAIDARTLEHHQRLSRISQRLELDDARIDAVVAALAAAMTGGGAWTDDDQV